MTESNHTDSPSTPEESKESRQTPLFSLDSMPESLFGDNYFGIEEEGPRSAEPATFLRQPTPKRRHTQKEPIPVENGTPRGVENESAKRLIIAAVIAAITGVLIVLWLLIYFFNNVSQSNASIQAYKRKNRLTNLYQGAITSEQQQNLGSTIPSDTSVAADESTVEATGTRYRLLQYPKNEVANIDPELYDIRKDINSDIIGRLTISGLMDEPVVQSSQTRYYLSHNAQKNLSQSGCVFMDSNCSIQYPPENLLLRGLASVEGERFSPFLKLLGPDGGITLSLLSTARLRTIYENEEYRLFAVLKASSDPASPFYFDYAVHPTFASDEAMMDYVNRCRQRSLYTFEVDVQPQDRLLTLATITPDTASEGEVVLVYRMFRTEEYVQ